MNSPGRARVRSWSRESDVDPGPRCVGALRPSEADGPVPRNRGRSRYLSRPMAQDPDPTIELTTARGVTRTLDDWTTSFHLAVTVLPGRPEALDGAECSWPLPT